MPGLIPLVLRPSEPKPRTSTSFQPGHSRSASAGLAPRPKLNLPKRYSQLPPASLPVIPYTQAEWRKAISEVKQQHMTRRYRACSARCAEILDNLKDAAQVEPAHLIYLHFYAAASLEMCTRPLPLTSPYRTALLQQARTHYDRATSLVRAAEDSVAAMSRSGSAAGSSRSSSSSGLYSPSSSVSSRAWTAETSVPSPTNSVCSFDELAAPATPPPTSSLRCRGRGPKRVKKVSFSLPLCTSKEYYDHDHDQEHGYDAAGAGRDAPGAEAAAAAVAAVSTFRFPEPVIRPDSPTLGLDDEYYFHAGASLRDLALPPSPPPPPQQPPPPPPPSKPSPTSSTTPHLPVVAPEHPLQPEVSDLDDSLFRVERSVHRYNETLSELRARLAAHSRHLAAQLAAADGGSSRPSSPATATVAAPTAATGGAGSGGPLSSSAAAATPAEEKSGAEEARAADRRARIERLRRSGWARKRFDARRYEDLAREVLAELE